MLSENVDVIKIDTIGRQSTRPRVSKMADRRYHVASLLIGVVMWTVENDTKTISVAAYVFENELGPMCTTLRHKSNENDTNVR